MQLELWGGNIIYYRPDPGIETKVVLKKFIRNTIKSGK
jgi:hypothetical protein